MVKKQTMTNRREAVVSLILTMSILVLLNVVAAFFYFRLDLTTEQRYSISKPTKEMVRDLKDIVTVKVYLDGDLNAGFTRLKESTRNLLKEFRAYGGKNIEYEFIDPMAIQNLDDRKAMITDLMQRGLAPTNLTTKNKTESKQQLIFPGAVVTYAGREIPVQLLDNQLGYSPQEILNHSEIQLEYKFANAIQKLTQIRPITIAFAHGHGELSKIETADLRQTLESTQFEVKDIDLPNTYFIQSNIDVLIVAKPRIDFDERTKDKYMLDQYVMRGGKVIWLVDGTNANMDSLRYDRGMQFVIGNDNLFNLQDMLFKYGVRVNTDVVSDMNMCNPIPMVIGHMGDAPQTEMVPWFYYPLLISDNNHAINKNLDPVASFFPSSIDTVHNPGVTKTILLHTSANAKAQMAPTRVSVATAQGKPDPGNYKQPNIPVAVLLEGQFESVFKNRMSPEFLAKSDSIPALKFVEQSKASKMIVISNGDIIANELKGDSSFYALGYYKFNRQQFANKDFILNCIQYLADDKGILATRSKEVKLRLLDTVKVDAEKVKWQMINILLPILLIVLFGIGFNWNRKRMYAR
jgi:ABC-2 type transport system permease protein